MGIPIQEQSKIFEKFYRVGDPLVHNTKGSGLGLSLVRHIVQAHGGNVSVESAPGKGSTFTIVLPVMAGGLPA
jgi:signal transduction histidine kinase